MSGVCWARSHVLASPASQALPALPTTCAVTPPVLVCRYAVELPTKLLTYSCVGFNAVATVPLLFGSLQLKAAAGSS